MQAVFFRTVAVGVYDSPSSGPRGDACAALHITLYGYVFVVVVNNRMGYLRVAFFQSGEP